MRFIPILSDLYNEFEARLHGMPDFALSAVLLLMAGLLAMAAFKLAPGLKPGLIAWLVLP